MTRETEKHDRVRDRPVVLDPTTVGHALNLLVDYQEHVDPDSQADVWSVLEKTIDGLDEATYGRSLSSIEVLVEGDGKEQPHVEEIHVPGVPSGTVLIQYDVEGRASIDTSIRRGNFVVAGATVDLPHERDLPAEFIDND